MYTLGKIIQGRKDAGLTTYCFFLDVQKAYDTVWRNGLWKKLWEAGIRGKMRRMVKKMTECAKRVEMLDGAISRYFIFYKELPKDVRCHQLCSRFSLTT